eukprot:TRINITY_DN18752_c0_g2_i3.p1 TRINITY_DN18752_c0_g2~~TRINITY_DN18752_c0_g2_i3.p1  ORF type:complete len:167 (-),score=27.44 TRINITY_DN18752_c0_g2_i3:118-618(-)
MSLEDEIDAVKRVNAMTKEGAVLITINWARSVLETRQAARAVSHVEAVRKAGLLGGMMFSGCSGVEGPYGSWKDSHMPHAGADGITHYADGSLLTKAEIGKCFSAATGSANFKYIGAKYTAKHLESKDVAGRVALYKDMLNLMSSEASTSCGPDEPAAKKSRVSAV